MCCYTPYGSKEMWEGAHPPIILWFSKYSFFNTTGQWCFIILFLIQLPGMSEKHSPAKLYTKAIQETLRDFLYYKRQAQVFTLIPARSHKLLSFIYFFSFAFSFASISSAISTSVFSSFGRMIFRMIANSAAGTIPEPPKIRLILSGSCASTAELEPSP